MTEGKETQKWLDYSWNATQHSGGAASNHQTNLAHFRHALNWLRRNIPRLDHITTAEEERKRQQANDLLNQFVLPAGGNTNLEKCKLTPSQVEAIRAAGAAGSASRAQLAAEFTLYSLRHTYITRLLLPPKFGGAGLDVRTVQKRAGHKSISTTEQYLRDIEVLKHATDGLPCRRAKPGGHTPAQRP